MRCTIIIPTYNEQENLEDLIRQILGLGIPDLSVVVVDDASPDGTGQIADQLAREHPAVTVVHRSGKLGLGTAYRAGIDRALQHGAEAVGTMDADFSHHPRYLLAMVAVLERADVVIGSRYVSGGATKGWPVYRKVLSRVANAVTRTLLGLPAHDATAGFRLYRRHVLERLDLDAIRSEGYSYLVEILTACHRAGFRIAEVPIVFENRTRGASKISRGEVWRAVKTVWRLARRK